MFKRSKTNGTVSNSSQVECAVGDTLQLQIKNDDGSKFYSQLIGYLPGKSLLVTSPRRDGSWVPLKLGQTLAVRLLADNNVVGFDANVLAVVTKPYPYVHLSYPLTSGKIVLRKAQRICAKLIVSVETENGELAVAKPVAAATFDLSTSGALLEAGRELGRVGELLTLKTRLNLGGLNEYLTIPAIIRNIRFDRNPETGRSNYYHGVEFRILEQHDSILLHGFIYEQLATH